MSKKNLGSLQYGFGSWMHLSEKEFPEIRAVTHINLTSRYVRQFSDEVHVCLFTDGAGTIIKDGKNYPVMKETCFVGNFLDLYEIRPGPAGLSYICISVNTAMISFIELSPHWNAKPLFPELPVGLLRVPKDEFEEILAIAKKLEYTSGIETDRGRELQSSIFIELFCRIMRASHHCNMQSAD